MYLLTTEVTKFCSSQINDIVETFDDLLLFITCRSNKANKIGKTNRLSQFNKNNLWSPANKHSWKVKSNLNMPGDISF